MTNNILSLDDVKLITQSLWQPNKNGLQPIVYAILDGARDKKIERILRQGPLKSTCLYEGDLSYQVRVSAPHLVRLEQNHPQTHDIIQQGWGRSWGVFAITYPPVSFLKVRHNCRKIAKVKGPDGQSLIFRYYDPRVLRTYLPNCNDKEAEKMFGPITDFVIETGDSEINRRETDVNENNSVSNSSNVIHRFRRTDNGVQDINDKKPLISNDTAVEIVPVDRDNRGVLQINREQFNSFEDARFRRFLKSMEQHLTTYFPAQVQQLNNKSLSSWVKNNVEQAVKFQLTSEQDICRYLNAAILHGEEIHQKDWVNEIMNEHYNPSTKSAMLEKTSLQILEQESDAVEQKVTHLRQSQLDQFYNTQRSKVHTIGVALFKLKFEDLEDEKSWIYRVGGHCLDHKLYHQMELDLWLDLSMRYGEDFYQSIWAKTPEQCSPQEQLQSFLKMQPHKAIS